MKYDLQWEAYQNITNYMKDKLTDKDMRAFLILLDKYEIACKIDFRNYMKKQEGK